MRSLTLFIIGSAAVHALALGVLSKTSTRAPVEIAPLHVTLERKEPARPLPTAPPNIAVEKPQRRPQERKVVTPPPPRQRVETAPVLAVPREPMKPEPAFSISVPEQRAAAELPAPAPRETPRAATKVDSGPPEQTSPPVFNAAYLRNPEPRYPVSARRRGEQGTVMLKVLVTREGAAAGVSVDKSSGSAVLDQAALETVRNWRFTPARRGTEPVESSVLVPIVFRLEGVS